MAILQQFVVKKWWEVVDVDFTVRADAVQVQGRFVGGASVKGGRETRSDGGRGRQEDFWGVGSGEERERTSGKEEEYLEEENGEEEACTRVVKREVRLK